MIDQYRITSANNLPVISSVTANNLKVEIDYLNPNEYVDISILASAKTSITKVPNISLRGKGIVGTREIIQKENGSTLNITYILAISLSLVSVFFSFIKDKIEKVSSKHSDEQKWIISFICGVCSLVEENDYYSKLSEKTSYWYESDRLCSKAIQLNENLYTNKVLLVLLNLLRYANIAESSQAIIHYNCAKLYLRLEKQKEAEIEIGYARKHSKKLINSRIVIDPLMNVFK
jgi:hypothetical protein